MFIFQQDDASNKMMPEKPPILLGTLTLRLYSGLLGAEI